MLDYGYRSKCCLAAIKVGKKKVKNSNEKITVWVCVLCGTKDVALVTKEEAWQIKNKDHLAPDIDDDNNYTD